MQILDPTDERTPIRRRLAHRPGGGDAGLRGAVALLDISKPRGDVFLDRVAEHLAAKGIVVERYAKPTFTKPAPVDLRHEIASKCDLVIEALAD